MRVEPMPALEGHVAVPGDKSISHRAVLLAAIADGSQPRVDDRAVTVTVGRRNGSVVEAVRRLDAAGVEVDDVAMRRPTLDDVFLSLTGHPVERPDGEESG